MNSLENFVKFIPSANNASITIASSPILTDTEAKSRRLINGITDVLYESTNEPSLGFYRIQEHVRKNIPLLIDKKSDIEILGSKIEGSRYDLDYSKDAINNITKTITTFDSIQSLITNSLYTARLLNLKNQKPISSTSSGSNITKSNTFISPSKSSQPGLSHGKQPVSSTMSSNNLNKM